MPGNIAEGRGREHTGDFLNFLSTSRGSVQELETYLLFANQRSYLTDAQLEPTMELADHVSRKLWRLRETLTAHPRRAARGSALARERP